MQIDDLRIATISSEELPSDMAFSRIDMSGLSDTGSADLRD